MPIHKPTLFIILFLFSIKIFSQDQLIYKNKPAKFVDKILTVTADSISYKSFKKTKTIALWKISGYYITVNTPENLKKRFYKRERTFHSTIDEEKIAQIELDPNKSFTNGQLKDLSKFKTNKFKNGFFVQNGDTNHCKIFIHNKNSPNNNLFLVTMDKNGNRTPYRASEVDLYFVNNNLFQSHRIDNDKIKTAFFLKLTVAGEYSLYERNSIPSHQEFTYFLQKKGEDYFHVMSPNNGSVELMQNQNINPNNGYSKLFFKVDNSTEDFKKAINRLFGTCVGVKNKVLTEFYTQNDLPTIVREYNKCK